MVCAIHSSPETPFLDHIAPLASLLGIPLIVNDETNAQTIRRYYPEVDLHYVPDLEFQIGPISKKFSTAIGCDYWHPLRKHSFKRLIFCPHGQSDKGYGSPILAPYAVQEAVLLYGDLMEQMLKELELWPHIPLHAKIGNFRLRYYEAHKQRLDAIAQNQIFAPLSAQRTLLYAPTWKDKDEATSFFSFGQKIARDLPDNWNLVIKVHPLLPERDPALFYRLTLLEKPNLKLVIDFPPIYPILHKVDTYLGDYSSIGYDFLALQKPMFFLPKQGLTSARLHQVGICLDPQEPIFEAIERNWNKASSLTHAQATLYTEAFSPTGNLKAIEALYG